MKRSKEAKEYRNTIHQQFARIGKAVSNPWRLELLDLLSQGPRTVESMAKAIDQSVANTSQHLQVLSAANMVDRTKEGLFVHYSLADEAVGRFYRSLRQLAERQLAEIDRLTADFLESSGLGITSDVEEIRQKVKNGEATVVDLRSVDEFDRGHIAGALSIPAGELDNRLEELPEDKDVVVYCRGPYCVIGIESAAWLREKGFKAHRLNDGFPEWKDKGLEFETSNTL